MLFFVFILVYLFAFLAEKRKKKRYLAFIIIVLSCFVGFRSRSVGIDTDMYYQQFENLRKGIFSPNVEKEFQIFSYILLRVMRTEYVILLFSFITNWLIILRLWSLKEKGPFHIMVMLYAVLLYPETANIMRQYLAIAIVFYATLYVERKKLLVYLLLVLTAILVHRSAFLALSYYPLYFWISHKKLNKKAVLGLAILTVAPIIVSVFMRHYSGNFALYLSGRVGIGLLYPVELAILMFFVLLEMPRFTIFRFEKDVVSLRFFVLTYLFGIIFSSLGYYRPTLYRIGLYFIIFETVFIPHVCTHGKNKYFFLLVYGGLIAFLIIQYHLAGWSGLINYSSWVIQ